MEKADLEDQHFLLTAIDQEKAFDRVNHDYMFRLLTKYGFHEDFVKTIQTIYTDITSQIKVNNTLTLKVCILSGVRQGCPLSMSLFVLCMEPLIRMVNKNLGLKGQHLTGTDVIKILCYTDDTTLILKNTTEYVRLMDIFKTFSKATNSKINDSKTEILLVGNVPRKTRLDDRLKHYIKDKIKVLGIYFRNDKPKLKLNYGPMIDKMTKLCNRYK